MNALPAVTEPPRVTVLAGCAGTDHTPVYGRFDGDPLPESITGPSPATPVASGYRDGRPWLLASLGARDAFGGEAARDAAIAVQARASELGVTELCWHVPPGTDDAALDGLIYGTLLRAHSPDRFKTTRPDGLRRLTVHDPAGRAGLIERATIVAQACNHARDLQNAPANLLTPSALAERARQLAGELDHVDVEILDEDEIVRRGMGAFASVARGSAEPAKLIRLRYDGPGAGGPVLGFVGKAVTFDSGGISIKTGNGIREMKFDMSGGAAVLEALGAIARLRLPVSVIAVAGATENMPSGHATRPGDIVRASNGTTIEVTNTDAEGRLVLADCLGYTIAQGAQRLVDVASLTGSVVTMFGGRYAALMANDDAWAAAVVDAGLRSGERVWRMPLDPWYAARIEGRYADIVNSRVDNDAGTILAGEFLHRFVGDTPWAHLDALAWDLPHLAGVEGGAGFGVRLLVELARTVN